MPRPSHDQIAPDLPGPWFAQADGVAAALVDRVQAFALAADASDVRVLRWPTPTVASAQQAIRLARPVFDRCGFVLCRPDDPRWWDPRGPLTRRHLALAVRGARDRARCAARLRDLRRESVRRHLVLDLTPVSAGRIWTPPSFRPSALGALGSRALRRLPFMQIQDALPQALHIVMEAEDDDSALTAIARWGRGAAGADLVAFVTTDGRAVVTECSRGDGLHEEERALARAADVPGRLDRPDGVTLAVPVRYCGAVAGSAIVRGPAERRTRLAAAADVVALVSGPALRARLDGLNAIASPGNRVPEIVGQSPAISAVREAICRAAATPFPVLIEGESGTGKELVARAIHRLSARRDRRCAAINCAALTDELADSELFGHARGAFTGAVGPRPGLFEEAHGGSLFLDEVAELSGRAQAKLLRAIQEREVRRVGENVPRVVDARLLSATNRPLRALVNAGAFREDLMFRLAVVQIRLPPLRDRTEDVAILAAGCWGDLRRHTGTRAVLGPDAMASLAAYDWPGNVRELQNVVARLSMLAPARGRVTSRHVEAVLAEARGPSARPAESLSCARETSERRTVAAALARHHGRRSAAARELGLTRQGLTKAMRRLSLSTAPGQAGVA